MWREGGEEGKRLLGGPRRKCVDNNKMDFLGIGLGGVDWIGVTQEKDEWGAFVTVVVNFRVP
jgi:hypothetical protein